MPLPLAEAQLPMNLVLANSDFLEANYYLPKVEDAWGDEDEERILLGYCNTTFDPRKGKTRRTHSNQVNGRDRS